MRANYGGVGADDNQAQAGHLVAYDVPEVSGTLGGGGQMRGWSDDLDRSGAFPVVAPDVAITLTASSNPNSNMAGRSKSDDVNLVVIPTVAFAENQQGEIRLDDISMPLACKGGKPGQGYIAIHDNRGRYAVHNGDNVCVAEDHAHTVTGSKGNPGSVTDLGMVRRLTPIECERLQGFEDDWTHMLSDSRRYKALGNAVAVPVSHWIAIRMAAAHRNATR